MGISIYPVAFSDVKALDSRTDIAGKFIGYAATTKFAIYFSHRSYIGLSHHYYIPKLPFYNEAPQKYYSSSKYPCSLVYLITKRSEP